jgi:hypothetical protein
MHISEIRLPPPRVVLSVVYLTALFSATLYFMVHQLAQ